MKSRPQLVSSSKQELDPVLEAKSRRRLQSRNWTSSLKQEVDLVLEAKTRPRPQSRNQTLSSKRGPDLVFTAGTGPCPRNRDRTLSSKQHPGLVSKAGTGTRPRSRTQTSSSERGTKLLLTQATDHSPHKQPPAPRASDRPTLPSQREARLPLQRNGGPRHRNERLCILISSREPTNCSLPQGNRVPHSKKADLATRKLTSLPSRRARYINTDI
jgi:hypothetical protein